MVNSGSDMHHQLAKKDGNSFLIPLDWSVGRVQMSVWAKRTHQEFKTDKILQNPFWRPPMVPSAVNQVFKRGFSATVVHVKTNKPIFETIFV